MSRHKKTEPEITDDMLDLPEEVSKNLKPEVVALYRKVAILAKEASDLCDKTDPAHKDVALGGLAVALMDIMSVASQGDWGWLGIKGCINSETFDGRRMIVARPGSGPGIVALCDLHKLADALSICSSLNTLNKAVDIRTKNRVAKKRRKGK
jgi:hypothetical protein